ncbi:hypothetical protein A2526_06020 [candidate division WOR-1 bacterium RIFOXYD2_FULL_36_8]|uniref:Uncharacterized protein n=1 Tax=candidate division WOR-1 bacterium RIFOXYB2_FULL_36_35 TaxID=1802578 RepID=A0A1F4S5Q7_UNCSA|nr:MAG: hypothetical protein A2230_05015 [candidate division WOR-1 bacterium RIFOXYA2_FULL_36_21]OGC15764.1 MAG: hypothetical protein A2290_05440 [candidate division WOR-1 bacterium RIFOXYB2_FULL_36_35]OGC21119.1 MAG: hypothetical protein A2282_03770 [candidate division WOR-1 bacterium RIFOXYA12_FULL_36_13]OGC39030.1 MAG: hypothetical protein A2526_06020 [candidate division WOR-1 bacterium RIFOXYD2_FULL_36_8]
MKLALGFFSAFFVGSGQILKGETEKGLKFMLTFYFGIPTLLYVTLAFSGEVFLIAFGIAIIFIILFWAYNVWDATKINNKTPLANLNHKQKYQEETD